MSKTIKRLLFGLFGLLTLIVLGLYISRLPIFESALQGYLDDHGVTPARFEIVEFDTGRLVLRNIVLGKDDAALKLLELNYNLTGLLRGEVEQIFIDGLRANLDLTGESPPLGELQGLLGKDGQGKGDEEDAGGSGAFVLPAIAIQDSVIMVATPAGTAELAVEGELWSDEAGTPQGALSYSLASEMGSLKGLVALSGQADGEVIGNVILDEGSLTLEQARATNLTGGGAFVIPTGSLDNLGLEFELAIDDLVFQSEGLPAPPFESARISAVVEGGDARMTVDLTEADSGLVLQLFAAAEDYLGEPQTALSAILELPPGSRLWDAFDLTRPEGGGLRIDLNASGPVPEPETLIEAALEDPWSLTDSELDFDFALLSEGLNLPDLATGLGGRLGLSGRLADGDLFVSVEEGSELTLAKPAAALLERLGIAPAAAEELMGLGLSVEEGRPLEARVTRQEDGLAVDLSGALALVTAKAGRARLEGDARFGLDRGHRLTAVEQAGFDLALTDIAWQGQRLERASLAATLSGSADNLSGRVTSRAAAPALGFGDIEARQLQASLKADIVIKSGQLTLSVLPSSTIQAREVTLSEGIALEEALDVTVGPGDLTVTRTDTGVVALRHKIALTLQGNSLTVARAGDVPLSLEFTPAPLSLDGSMTGDLGYALTLRLLQMNLRAPDADLEAKGLALVANYNSGLEGLGLNFTADSIADSGQEPRFAPLSLKGQLTQTDSDSFRLSARAGWPDAPDSLTLEADIQPGEARGSAELVLGPFDFTPGGLQPAALSPRAALLEKVEGRIESGARLTWVRDSLISSGNLTLENLSFTAQGTRVEGLDLALDLTDLTAPTSLANQRLTIASMDPGLPVTDLLVIYRILPGALPVLQIDDGRFSVLGGEFGLEPTTLDPAQDGHNLTFDIRNLALESLFESLELDGVSGEGTLNGRVPIRLEGSAFAIADGQLSAASPGRLRIRSDEAEELIGQRDENVDSMLAALRDFRYEEFTVTVDKNSDEDLILALSVLGNNPDVLNGQMFQINVNLESNIENVINAISEGLAVSDQRIRDLWRRFK